MGNILKDSQGNVLVASGNAFEATAAIDSNIQAGNIKSGVTILGVTGTYEGSGGGASITFYPCTEVSSKGNSDGTKAGDPGTQSYSILVEYTSPQVGEVPIGFIIHNKGMWKNVEAYGGAPEYFAISLNSSMSNGNVGMYIKAGTLTTSSASFNLNAYAVYYNISNIEIAPIFPSMLTTT